MMYRMGDEVVCGGQTFMIAADQLDGSEWVNTVQYPYVVRVDQCYPASKQTHRESPGSDYAICYPCDATDPIIQLVF